MTDVVLRPLPLPSPEIEPLLAASEAEGFRFLRRLVDEHAAGTTRFDGAGEALLGAYRGERLVAVCGLTRDPYSGDPRTGRLRHLYVLPSERRGGVGRALVDALVAHARARFDVLTLRTDTAAAARFYEALGFRPEPPGGAATHRLPLGEAR